MGADEPDRSVTSAVFFIPWTIAWTGRRPEAPVGGPGVRSAQSWLALFRVLRRAVRRS
jgi:hypothetical protein